jgi:hypothetical protein
MLYSFDNATSPERRKTQYFEIAGNRGIYHDGWFAGTVHKAPWENTPRRKLAEDEWELYNVNEDFSLSVNLASKNSAKLDELKTVFTKEAIAYNVLPIDDRTIERFDAKIAGRPDLMNGRKKLILYPGSARIMENAFINMKNTSYSITAEVDLKGAGQGVIVCQGGDFGGWSLYLKEGKPSFAYNWMGIETTNINAAQKLTPGKHTIKFDFAYEGGRGKGGRGTIFVDGKAVAEGIIKQTHSNVYGLDEPADVGTDSNTPVTPAYHGKPGFTGKIQKVVIELI